MKAPRWLRHPVLTFNRLTYCVFWGCAPERDGEKWRVEDGVIRIDPVLHPWCGKCKGVVPLDQARRVAG